MDLADGFNRLAARFVNDPTAAIVWFWNPSVHGLRSMQLSALTQTWVQVGFLPETWPDESFPFGYDVEPD